MADNAEIDRLLAEIESAAQWADVTAGEQHLRDTDPERSKPLFDDPRDIPARESELDYTQECTCDSEDTDGECLVHEWPDDVVRHYFTGRD
jgi:hypothetical protein